MFNWQVKMAAAFLLIVCLFGAYKRVGHNAVEEYKLTQVVEQAKVNKELQDKYDNLSAEYEVAKASKKIVYKTLYKTVEKVIEKPVYSQPCMDTEGVEVANKALAGGKDELF